MYVANAVSEFFCSFLYQSITIYIYGL